jgi:branched-chain amino acid transport system substrate-binding protein
MLFFSSAIIAGALVISGCGSSSGNSNAAGGSSSSGAASATGSTWTIGAIGTFSGISSSATAPAQGALQAWADYTNAHGGINGHQIRVISLDDQGVASVSLADAHTLIQGDHVIALVGSQTDLAGAWGAYAKQQGVPIIGGGVITGTFLQGNSDFYATSPGTTPNNDIEMQVAKQLGATQIGMMYCAEVAGCQITTALDTAAANAEGVHLVKSVAVSSTAPSYTAPCLALKNAGSQAIVMNVTGSIIQSIADQCAQQGFHPVYIGIGADISAPWTTDPALAKSGGELGTFPWFNTENPAVAAFNQAMNQYDTSPAAIGETGAEEWESAMIFEAAAKAAKLGDNPTPAQVIQGLNSLSGNTLGGLFAPINYTNGNRTENCGYAFAVSGKKLTLLFGGKAQQC